MHQVSTLYTIVLCIAYMYMVLSTLVRYQNSQISIKRSVVSEALAFLADCSELSAYTRTIANLQLSRLTLDVLKTSSCTKYNI